MNIKRQLLASGSAFLFIAAASAIPATAAEGTDPVDGISDLTLAQKILDSPTAKSDFMDLSDADKSRVMKVIEETTETRVNIPATPTVIRTDQAPSNSAALATCPAKETNFGTDGKIYSAGRIVGQTMLTVKFTFRCNNATSVKVIQAETYPVGSFVNALAVSAPGTDRAGNKARVASKHTVEVGVSIWKKQAAQCLRMTTTSTRAAVSMVPDNGCSAAL